MDKTHVTTRRLRYGPDTSGKALAEWRESLAFLYESLEPTDPAAPFELDCAITQLPRACLMDCVGSGLVMSRSEAYAATHPPIDQIVLFRLTSGRVVANYQGRDTVLEAGDLVALDYQRAQMSRATAFRCANIALPRKVAPSRFRSGALHGVRIAAASPTGRLLNQHIDALFALVTELSADEAEAAVGALMTLAAAVWPEASGQPAVRSDAVLDRAVAFIEAHLADPDLGPAEICEALGVSRTTLYRLFAPAGGVGAMILKRRLETSVLALMRNALRPGVVKQIAGECGFRTSTHFTKAFRDRFGRTPGDVAALRSGDVGGGLYTDWFDARAREAGFDTVALWLKGRGIE